MELYHAIISFLNSHTTETLAVLLGSSTLSVILETVLHRLHTDSQKVAHALLQAFSIISTGVTFILATITPENTFGIYAGLFITTSVIRRFLVSPIYLSIIVPFLQYKAQQKPATAGQVQSTTPTEQPPAQPDNFVSQ